MRGGSAVGGCAEVIRHGRRWLVTQAEHSVVVDHLVGMLHLAVLLANPQREIAAVELAGGADVLRSVQPLLDHLALRQYRSRVAEPGVSRAELEWLTAQLSGAAGFGGRTRGFADNAERARIAVGKAIRRAIDRITEADPIIGRHLSDCVHTGIRCVYRPI